MSRKLATLIATVLLCFGAAPAALGAPPSPYPAGSSGLGDPYFPLDGNGGYDVQHYDLVLTYDPASDQLTGIATITRQGDAEPLGVQFRLHRPAAPLADRQRRSVRTRSAAARS